MLPLRPFDFPPSPHPASQGVPPSLYPKCHGTRLSDRHLLVYGLLQADPPQTLLRSSPSTTPPSTPNPYVLITVHYHLAPPYSSFHSHKADRQGSCQRPSEEKRRPGQGWSRPRYRSRKAQRYDPPFRLQLLKKVDPRARSSRAIKAEDGYRARSDSPLLL